MTDITKAKLAFGPMSTESIDAVFKYSETFRKEMMLIASKNQIDYSGGYVNNWNTAQYMNFVRKMRTRYPHANVAICRDHCGPGFNGNHDLKDSRMTIKTDIENGFDLIHIDFCHYHGEREEMLARSREATMYALSLNHRIALEIGTDENDGSHYSAGEIDRIASDVTFFKEFCNPEFFVVQTGSLIKEMQQVGTFNQEFVGKIHGFLKSQGLKLKEHNADYLSVEEIEQRKGIVDAMNIAPQLGAVQTLTVLQQSRIYGVSPDAFLEEAYNGGKWKKWLNTNNPENRLLCSTIAGHYHFASENYKNLVDRLSKRTDIQEKITNSLVEVIEHYGSSI